MTGPVYTDVETLLADRLHARLAVKTWIDPRLPERWNFDAPLVHIQRGGDGDTRLTLDAAIVDIDVYARIADNARVIAERIRTEVRLHLPAFTLPSGVTVTGTGTITAPRWLPDPTVYRRGATYRVIVHGLTA